MKLKSLLFLFCHVFFFVGRFRFPRQMMSSAPDDGSVPDESSGTGVGDSSATEPLPVEGSASTDAELSQYERERNERIAANRQLLVDLGLASAIRSFLFPSSPTSLAPVRAVSITAKPLPQHSRANA